MKRDYLKDCMGDIPGTPIDEFNRRYCVLCANRDCSRSAASTKVSFDRRVANWRSDLFDAVPRADDNDPGFASIRSKRFVPLDASSPYEIQHHPSGVMLEKPADPQPDPSPAPAAAEQPADPPAAAAGPPEPAGGATEPEEPDAAARIPVASYNTPFQQGAMLPGAPQKRPPEVVVDNGGTFTFGDDK